MDRLFSLGWRLWQYFFIKDIYFFCENPKTKIHDGSGIHLKDSLNVIWQRSICCLQSPPPFLLFRPGFSASSITPMLKLSSFDDGHRIHAKPRPPNPTDVMLVPIPVLPTTMKKDDDDDDDDEENEGKILKRILKEINQLEALRQKHQVEAKDREKV